MNPLMNSAQEFSFPLVPGNSLVSLPPFWKISTDHDDARRPRFASESDYRANIMTAFETNPEEETMDVLWQYFNEETISTSPTKSSSDGESSYDSRAYRRNSYNDRGAAVSRESELGSRTLDLENFRNIGAVTTDELKTSGCGKRMYSSEQLVVKMLKKLSSSKIWLHRINKSRSVT